MVSMAAIASACGVSRTVVSMVLNGRDKKYGISAETRNLVLKTSRSMGYCRDEVATSMASKQGNILAFVSEPMGDISYTGRILNGVLDAASANGLMLMTLHLTPENSQQILQKLLGWRVRGVIFHIQRFERIAGLRERLDEQQIPMVTVNLNDPACPGVTTDDGCGIRKMVELFQKRGAKKPVLLLPHVERATDYLSSRLNGFYSGMREFYPGVEAEVFDAGGEIPYVEKTLPKRIRQSGGDGVICIADDHAFRFWQCALQTGYGVPEDFLLSGFGATGTPGLTEPALTTVEQDFEKMGSLATGIVIGHETQKNILLPVSVREEGTTKFSD